MYYILIDESGDIGNPKIEANSKDFTLAAFICSTQNIEHLSEQVTQLKTRLKKKEIKYSKLSQKEIQIVEEFLKENPIITISVYAAKDQVYGKEFLKNLFKELIEKIPVSHHLKTKFFIDGTENAFFRKLYTPLIKSKFSKSSLHFANSINKSLIQIADFYAGKRRRSGK